MVADSGYIVVQNQNTEVVNPQDHGCRHSVTIYYIYSDPQNQNTQTAEMYRVMVADALGEQQNQSIQNIEINPKNHGYRH